MTADLIAFLRARFDEDEQMARAAGGAPWESTVPGMVHVSAAAIAENRHAWGKLGYVARTDSEEYRDHIARHDPARVLREVEAKRRILERHQPRPLDRWVTCSNCRPVDPDYPSDLTSVLWPCPDLRDLATPYSDHPDFDPAWSTD